VVRVEEIQEVLSHAQGGKCGGGIVFPDRESVLNSPSRCQEEEHFGAHLSRRQHFSGVGQ